MKVSIIVPCYNEEGNIQPIVQEFIDVAKHNDIELILVDNGSADTTSEKIDQMVEKYDFVKKSTVKKNQGYGNGILTGISASCGDVIGWIHADLQSSPKVFLEMIPNAEKEKGDFLYKGRRVDRSMGELFFTYGMGIFETFLFKMRLWDVNSQPTLMSKSFFESWKNPPKDFSLDLFAYTLAKKRKIPVRRFRSPQQKRMTGNSSWNINGMAKLKMIKRVIDYSLAVKKRLKFELK